MYLNASFFSWTALVNRVHLLENLSQGPCVAGSVLELAKQHRAVKGAARQGRSLLFLYCVLVHSTDWETGQNRSGSRAQKKICQFSNKSRDQMGARPITANLAHV
jgi:hypothetical protein